MVNHSSSGTDSAHLRRIILGLFNPMPDGHEKGCLHNDPHIHPRGPCICRYSEVAGEYLWALREAKKIAAGYFDKQDVEKSRRLQEPAELVDAAASRGVAQGQSDRGALTKLAAECHRAKWQFDLNEDYKPTAKVARAMILKAFDELHRIGDVALKLRDASSVPSTQRCTWPNCDQPSGHDYCHSHCLADRGAAVASTRRETEA